jgi:hypothetical protein
MCLLSTCIAVWHQALLITYYLRVYLINASRMDFQVTIYIESLLLPSIKTEPREYKSLATLLLQLDNTPRVAAAI